MKKFLTRTFLIIFTAIISFPGTAAEIKKYSFKFNNTERNYLVYVPEEIHSNPALMLVLHGGLGNANSTLRFGMNSVADHEGFVVAYPEGSSIGGGFLTRNRRTWNAGECCGKAARDNVNDIAYLSSLIDTLVQDFEIDSGRVYVTGMSNGAMMTYRLVCELPDKIAAAVPVSGTLTIDNCPEGNNIPVFHIHGDADDNVPIEGGEGSRGIANMNYRPLAETFSMITARRDCSAPVISQDNDGSQRSTYSCNTGAPLIVKIIPGGGHTWPGGERRLSRNNSEFSASEAAWEFASQHRQP